MLIGLLTLLGLATAIILIAYITIVCWEVVHPERRTAGWALAHGMPTTPEDFDLPYEEWTVDRPDGTRLPVWDIPADPIEDGTAEDAPTVIVIHGWSRSRIDSLVRVQQLLVDPNGARRRFRTILPDLRGHGDASEGRTTLGSSEVGDLEAILDTLGEGPFILVGHSLGAVLALHLAGRRSEQIRSVLAIAPYDRLATPFDGYLRSRDFPAGPFSRMLEHTLRLCGIRMRDTNEIAAGLSMPIEVMVGSEDRVCPPSIARRITASAQRAQCHELPDTGHSNHHVRGPQDFRRLFERCLEAE
ncbi:MAG: alpha/beta hydrolase [Phycisphaerales bacterium]|nr:alpha/beta hydrolase [Phycisphaerales bacterium]